MAAAESADEKVCDPLGPLRLVGERLCIVIAETAKSNEMHCCRIKEEEIKQKRDFLWCYVVFCCFTTYMACSVYTDTFFSSLFLSWVSEKRI